MKYVYSEEEKLLEELQQIKDNDRGEKKTISKYLERYRQK